MRCSGLTVALLGTALLASGLACSKTPVSIAVSPVKVEISDIGGSVPLVVTVKDKKGNPIPKAPLKFETADPKIADVEPDGLVCANASGDTMVTVTSGTVSTKVPVRIRLVTTLDLTMGLPTDVTAAGVLNGTYALKVTALDEARKPADLSRATWKSSAPSVATVDGSGVLTLFTAGKTEISVQMGKTVAKLPVTVEILVPMAIKLESPTVSVKAGETALLPYSVVSDKGTLIALPPTFTSSAPDVVSVDPKGVVSGLKRGSAQVKIQVGEALNTVAVTVR